MTAGAMIAKAEIRRLLADKNIFAHTIADLDDDAALTMDSLAVVWLVHRLEEEYGISLDPAEVEPETSVNRLHAILSRRP